MFLSYNNSPFWKQRPKIQNENAPILTHSNVQLKDIYSDYLG